MKLISNYKFIWFLFIVDLLLSVLVGTELTTAPSVGICVYLAVIFLLFILNILRKEVWRFLNQQIWLDVVILILVAFVLVGEFFFTAPVLFVGCNLMFGGKIGAFVGGSIWLTILILIEVFRRWIEY